MKIKKLSLVLALVSAITPAAFAQLSCPASPALHAAVFNTQGTSSAPNASERIAALATLLPQTADARNLDVLCLNELRDASLRSTVVQGFQNDASATWNIYQPPPASQPGCQSACLSNVVTSFNATTLPLNVWVQVCSLSPLPSLAGSSCAQLPTQAGFESCEAQFCPFLAGFEASSHNPSCSNCLEDAGVSQNIRLRTQYCSATFNAESAGKCMYGSSGEAGGTLISRYPFLATDYHQFALPAFQPLPGDSDPNGPGQANWGITYGKIQTPMGPVHLFCASHVTSESAMDPTAAEALNGAQSQEVLTYIQSKANGEPAIYLSSTGTGPAVSASPATSANAQWPEDFALLQGGLRDALLANLDASSNPFSAATCTFGCGDPTPAAAGYVDHIMTSGMGTAAQGYRAPLCATNGGTLFTTDTASTANGPVPVSTHYGVIAGLSVGNNVTSLVAITASGLSYNRGTKTGTENIAIKNLSATSIPGPIQLFLAINNSAASASNAAGSYAGSPYWVSSGSLAPGASVTIKVAFTYAPGVSFTTIPTVYSGAI